MGDKGLAIAGPKLELTGKGLKNKYGQGGPKKL